MSFCPSCGNVNPAANGDLVAFQVWGFVLKLDLNSTGVDSLYGNDFGVQKSVNLLYRSDILSEKERAGLGVLRTLKDGDRPA